MKELGSIVALIFILLICFLIDGITGGSKKEEALTKPTVAAPPAKAK